MSRKRDPNREYDHESLRDEREYGFYWYSGLWNILRPVLIVLASLLIVFGLASGVYAAVDEHFISPVDPADTQEYAFSVESGNSLTRVANNLEEQGLIKSRTFFKYYCDFAGLGQKIQAADYLIKKSMDVFEIADLLTTGDGNPITTDITIIPGDHGGGHRRGAQGNQGIFDDTSEFLNICKTGEGVTDYYFIDEELKTENVESRRYLLEGYLAPNTYEIYTDASALDIIKKLLSQTDKVFTAEWQARAGEIGMTMDQVLALGLHDREGGQEGGLCQGERGVPQPPRSGHAAPERPDRALRDGRAAHGAAPERPGGGFPPTTPTRSAACP